MFLAASLQIIFLFYFFFIFPSVYSAKPHFAALLQPAAPGAEPESPSGCYATATWTPRIVNAYHFLYNISLIAGEQ